MLILAIGGLATVLYFGAPAVGHGIKKVGHQFGCMLQHGRSCLKK